MQNALELIRSLSGATTFQIGEFLFAQFACPVSDQPIGIWAETDHLIHVVSGTSIWKTTSGEYTAKSGESIFFKKGAYISPPHMQDNLCVQIFFLPHSYIRETILEIAKDLPALGVPYESNDPAIQVHHDVGLRAFLEAMTVYFAGRVPPAESLLKLKVKELLTSILLGKSNPDLSCYLRSIADCSAPSIRAIMERNFCHNLSIEEFARLCHRSISSFKRDFRKHFGTSPRKWLLERRLRHSLIFLETTNMNITQIALECGFMDLSHFSNTFKRRFGHPPALYREIIFDRGSSNTPPLQHF